MFTYEELVLLDILMTTSEYVAAKRLVTVFNAPNGKYHPQRWAEDKVIALLLFVKVFCWNETVSGLVFDISS